jgi:hypothetical protein
MPLAAAAALALSACAGSSSSSSSAAASSPTSSSQTSTSSSTTTSASSITTSSTTTASSSSGTAALPPCNASGLDISFLGQQGATGHGELGFAVKNTTSTTCNTIGYPGIQFLDKSGAPLPTKPTHTTLDFFGHSPYAPVILQPGQTASFRLGVTHGIGSEVGCTTAYALQVIPPNDTATLHVDIPGGAVECGTATVSPMRPGTSAYP